MATQLKQTQAPRIQLLTAREVADDLGIADSTLDRWIQEGRIPPPLRIGRNRRWRAREIADWYEAGCPRVDPKCTDAADGGVDQVEPGTR